MLDVGHIVDCARNAVFFFSVAACRPCCCPRWHEPILDALVRLPPLSPGDAVFWHTGEWQRAHLQLRSAACLNPGIVFSTLQWSLDTCQIFLLSTQQLEQVTAHSNNVPT